MSNVIQFPNGYDPEPDFNIVEMYEECLNRRAEPQVIRVVLPDPPPPNPATGALVAVACFVIAFAVVTAALS